jgi:prepilin-type N-terminal cleavage/methylation domain-containing protein
MRVRPKADGGFTLLELLVVLFIVALIMGIAAPSLMPSIDAAGLEGQAQHVANYGRAAIAHCTLMREHFIVKFDFAENRYWAERILPDEEAFAEQFGDDITGLGEKKDDAEDVAPEDMDPAERALDLRMEMNLFAESSLRLRADNVPQDGMLADIGPDFKEFTTEAGEAEEEIVQDHLLEPVLFANGVTAHTINTGSVTHSSGTVEIEIMPLGLGENAVFYLTNEGGEFYTVVWDAITGGARIYPGKELNP